MLLVHGFLKVLFADIVNKSCEVELVQKTLKDVPEYNV